MCIIAYKPAGVALPTKKTLETCFSNNKDGAGIMYYDKSKDTVVIVKGLMTFKDFWQELSKLRKEVDLDSKQSVPAVMHFRIGTHGANNAANTHPFPLTKDEQRLKALRLTTKVGIAHNGIINKCSDPNKILSDTQVFIKDHLYPLSLDYPLWFMQEQIKKLVADFTNSRLAVMFKDHVSLIGDWVKEGSMYYSNSTYKSYVAVKGVYSYNDLDDCWLNSSRYTVTRNYKNSGKTQWGWILGQIDKYVAPGTAYCPNCGLNWKWCDCGEMYTNFVNEFTVQELAYIVDIMMYDSKTSPLRDDLNAFIVDNMDTKLLELKEAAEQ